MPTWRNLWGGQPYEVTFWRRPLTAITAAISSAGFVIDRLVEPAPLPSLQQHDPQAYDKLRTRPGFLFFRLVNEAQDALRRGADSRPRRLSMKTAHRLQPASVGAYSDR